MEKNTEEKSERGDRALSTARGIVLGLYFAGSILHGLDARTGLNMGYSASEVEKIIFEQSKIKFVMGLPARALVYYSDFAEKRIAEDPEFYKYHPVF